MYPFAIIPDCLTYKNVFVIIYIPSYILVNYIYQLLGGAILGFVGPKAWMSPRTLFKKKKKEY